MLILGNKEISFVALGNTEISSAYKGNTEVYANANDNMPPFVASEWTLYGDAEAWNYKRSITVNTNYYQTRVEAGSWSNAHSINFICGRHPKNKGYKSCVIKYSNSGKASSWTGSGYGDTFYLKGSNDDVNWVDISSKGNGGAITSDGTITLPISGNYTYLRLVHRVNTYMYNDDSGIYYTTVKSIEFVK